MSDPTGSAPATAPAIAANASTVAGDAGSPAQGGFNLSAWALRHQALVFFLIAMVALFGVLSYSGLRNRRTRRSPSR